MDRVMNIPYLAPMLTNQTALSVLIHNPLICARTIARPAQMLGVVIALAASNPGAEHLNGALDARFPALHPPKTTEVMEVVNAGSPEAAVVRQHHQAALAGMDRLEEMQRKEAPSAQHHRPDPVERSPLAAPHPQPQAVPHPQPQAVDVRTMTAGTKIREVFREMFIERLTTSRPHWGGRLVEILANPRGPFGISPISDALAPAVEEFRKDHPRLVAFLIRTGGLWPAPSDPETLEIMHSAAKIWARRLVRPILLGIIDQHRKQVAELNGDSKPAWYRHEELDKELKAAKDVHGEYLVNPVIAKRPRD